MIAGFSVQVFFRTTPEGNPWCNSKEPEHQNMADMAHWSEHTWRVLSGERPPPDPDLYKLQVGQRRGGGSREARGDRTGSIGAGAGVLALLHSARCTLRPATPNVTPPPASWLTVALARVPEDERGRGGGPGAARHRNARRGRHESPAVRVGAFCCFGQAVALGPARALRPGCHSGVSRVLREAKAPAVHRVPCWKDRAQLASDVCWNGK